MTYDLGPKRDTYYKQGNNDMIPKEACKPTATTEGLELAGWSPENYLKGPYRCPEDNLTYESRGTRGAFIKDAHHLPPTIAGNELWEVVTEVVNGYFYAGEKLSPVIGPRWNWDLRQALWGIAVLKRPFIASTWLTRQGHVVVMKGFTTTQEEMPSDWRGLDMTKIQEIIIDDPAGLRTVNGYRFSGDGFSVRYSVEAWLKYWRSTGIQIRNAKEVG